MLIRIIEADIQELVDTIWDTDGITAICVKCANSKYTTGFKVKAEELGNYKSVKCELLYD